jgi:hypothetical protein
MGKGHCSEKGRNGTKSNETKGETETKREREKERSTLKRDQQSVGIDVERGGDEVREEDEEEQ